MAPGIIKFFRGDRKYFTIVFLVLILIILSGVITPVITGRISAGWKNILAEEIRNIETTVNSSFKEKEDFLLSNASVLKTGLKSALNPGDADYGSIIRILNHPDYQDLAIEVYAPNGRLIGWNTNSPVEKSLPFPLKFGIGEAYFTNTELLTWLTVLDTIDFESDHFYVVTYLPFQKHYYFQNPYYRETDFQKEVTEKLQSIVKIVLNADDLNRNGTYSSFALLNKRGSRIAEINFQKPMLDSRISAVVETSSTIQGILLIVGFMALLFAFRGDYNSIKSSLIKFLLLLIYLTGFRILLFILNIPGVFLNGNLNDPLYFSSKFAWGIVKSPVEFLITNIFLLIISILFFRFLNQLTRKIKGKAVIYFMIIIPALFLYLMSSRGLAAAVRSIIFDSSLRYFRSSELIPGIPEMIMMLNMLLLGAVVIILLLTFLHLPISFREKDADKYSWITFIILEICGLLFIAVQPQPLVTYFMQFIFICIIFLIYRLIIRRPGSAYNYIYIALASSVISISLLNYFNQDLEKESLKTTAFELNRPNENLLTFLLRETLRTSALQLEKTSLFIDKKTNYSGAAFDLWSESLLQKESLNSSISILDRNKKLLGDFRIGTSEDLSPGAYFEHYSSGEIQIVEIPRKENRRIFKGIVEIKDEAGIQGYVAASVVVDMLNPAGIDYPDFLMSPKNFYNSVIDVNQLKIFEIIDSRLVHVYGDIYPSREQIKPLINADYSAANESWHVLTLNNEKYFTYSLKNSDEGNEKITTVLYREKQITWNLYNFFKIFIVHVIYILILFLVIFIFRIRDFKYTFRFQLLTAFLLISIIPVIVLAIYNRQAVRERTLSAISRELSEKLDYVEKNVSSQLRTYKDRDFKDAFDNAALELGISFNVYENTNQVFSSRDQYYKAGLFPSKLNPEANYQLSYLSFREVLIPQKVENYDYFAFYKKLNIEGKDLVISVNDAFNKVKLSFTSADADILLFGVYSFAVIIIIIINTIMANRISAPIRKLIRAANAVGQGDLNIQVENKARGEMHDLIDGFNAMTRELQKNESDLALLERETAWKEMAKQVAHEIKNPLTPMKLAVQQMIISFRENKNFEAIFSKITTTLLNQIESLNQIASEFSRFARMPNFNLEKVNLVSVLKDTCNLFVDEKIQITFSSDPDEAFAEGDNSQLRRLIINMVRNSIQAGANKISVYLKRSEEGFEILVEDNGSGIKPEFREKIFEPDFTTKEKGMGIGLKLAKRFIEGIHGSIKLVDSSENGTIFRIYIPEAK